MELWSDLHLKTLLPAIFVFAGISIFLGIWLAKKDESIRLIPIKILSVILVLLEIAKQIYSISIGYDLYNLPLHFCSIIVFLLPIFAFYKGKHCRPIRCITSVCCLLATLVTIVCPCIVYSRESIRCFSTDFLCAHAVIFHNLIILTCMLVMALNLNSFKTKQDSVVIIVACFSYSALAGTIANTLKTNFNNFYYAKISFLENIRINIVHSLGVGGQILYVVAVATTLTIGAFVSYFLLRLHNIIIEKIKNKTKKPA